MAARNSILSSAVLFVMSACSGNTGSPSTPGASSTASPHAGSSASSMARWQQWVHLKGVFDLGGVMPDGALMTAASDRLFSVALSSAVAPYASGTGGYRANAGGETYIAASPGLELPDRDCSFTRGEIFALQLGAPLGVVRVDVAGRSRLFARLPAGQTLNGIVFDDVGKFGHRLLVTGGRQGKTAVFGIDCRGGVRTVTQSAPPVEGGLAVAPDGFGAFAGFLVAPDENSGNVIAISPSGEASVLVASGVPHGGDIGVESAGFIPRGFAPGGAAYVADRGTANNPHPGNDSILRLEAASLIAAGVREGDLLVASEGGAVTISVRCATSCTARQVAVGPSNAHVEGHLIALPGSAG